VANHPGHDLHLNNQADLPPIESGEPSTNATLGPFPHTKLHHTDNQHITETLAADPHFQAGVWHTTFQNSLTLKRLQITTWQITPRLIFHLYNPMDLPHTKAHHTDNQHITETPAEDPHF
jgi:hypothetical protein